MKKRNRISLILCTSALIMGTAISASAAVVTNGLVTLPAFRNAALAGAGTHTNTYSYVDFYGGYDCNRIYAFTESSSGKRSGTVYIDVSGTGVITPDPSVYIGDLLKCYIGNDGIRLEETNARVRVDV